MIHFISSFTSICQKAQLLKRCWQVVLMIGCIFLSLNVSADNGKPRLKKKSVTISKTTTTVIDIQKNSLSSQRTYVEFAIKNDIGEDYPYFLGGPSQIAKGTTRTFNYPEGTELYRVDANGEKGKEWFTVHPDMDRQTYLLSDLMHQAP